MIALVITAGLAFIAGLVIGKRRSIPTFYEPRVDLARVVLLDAVRDRRADISCALRGRS